MTEKELQESRKLFGQALAEALAEKYDEELKEAPDVKLPVDHDVTQYFIRVYPLDKAKSISLAL